MKSDGLVRFSATIPRELLDELDAYAVRRGSGANRSETIRDLIREKLVSEAMASPKEPVVGSITLIYNHHASELSQQIDHIQHEYGDLIVSAMHVHLDDDNCLEIIAVHGCGMRVFELRDRLLGLRGVKYGTLSCAAPDRQLNTLAH